MIDLEKLDSCAVVGNSGAILEGSYGKYIDNHELVVRCRESRILL
jgi:hypothetical protein